MSGVAEVVTAVPLESIPLESITVTTRRGLEVDVLVGGPVTGEAVVSFHGFAGPLVGEPMLAELAAAGYRVHAPVWPGYSDHGGDTVIEDMLDFALHGADIIEALSLGPAHGQVAPHVIGHSMGGMIAAEMAALAPNDYGHLVLIAPLGLWLDGHPVPDIYTLMPYEFPRLLFRDATLGTRVLASVGADFSNPDAIQRFLIGNSRRLGTAGKILFPIPNRRLSKRLYRITNPVMLLWGDSDAYLGAPYADAWSAALPDAERATIAEAGHMVPYEQPTAAADAIVAFLRG